MIKKIFISIIVPFFFASCSKKEASTTVIEYQVIATNSSKIDIEYNNAIGNKVSVIGKDTWTFDINNPTKPFKAYLKGSSTSPFSSITTKCYINILVNGSLVKSDSASSNGLATVEAEYTVQ